MDGECKQSLTLEQFNEIMQKIKAEHQFGNIRCHKKWVKYVRPSFDMRDGKCFYIKIDDKEFDFRDGQKPMYERIMTFLDANPVAFSNGGRG